MSRIKVNDAQAGARSYSLKHFARDLT